MDRSILTPNWRNATPASGSDGTPRVRAHPCRGHQASPPALQRRAARTCRPIPRPLADKISGYLQCLFGVDARAVIALQNNAFTGLELVRTTNGGGAIPFGSLSGGTREQLAAAVRLAMAEVLAEDHDGCLPVVFDDSFAYSDPNRVRTLQDMLDLGARRGLQIIVLTCNPTDYAGLGAHAINLRVETAPAPLAGIPLQEIRTKDLMTTLA